MLRMLDELDLMENDPLHPSFFKEAAAEVNQLPVPQKAAAKKRYKAAIMRFIKERSVLCCVCCCR